MAVNKPDLPRWRIPLSDLNYGEEEERAVVEVLRLKWLTMGPKTEEFEALMAAYLGVKHAVALANCTCALELAYEYAADRVETHSQIIVPDMTFVATANAAGCAGTEAILADIADPNTPFLCAKNVAKLLAAADQPIAAVSIVHYAGFDSNSEEFAGLANEHHALLIEDAAHGMGGGTKSGRALGTTGTVGCFSFFSNKNLATGEGGMIVTNDNEIAAEARLARSHGMTSQTSKRHAIRGHGYDVVRIGHNYRCTEIAAALGIAQLKKLDAANARRRVLWRLYRDAFASVEQFTVPFGEDEEAIANSACHIFPLLCGNVSFNTGGSSGRNARATLEDVTFRDGIRRALDEAGIQTSHHYPPLHTLAAYAERHEAGDFPAATAFAQREITLPLYPGLKESEVEEICEIVIHAANNRP